MTDTGWKRRGAEDAEFSVGRFLCELGVSAFQNLLSPALRHTEGTLK